MPAVSLEPAEDLAIAIVRRFLVLCENPRSRATMMKLVRGAGGGSTAARRFYSVVTRTVLSPLARRRGVQLNAMKMELIAAQLVGIAVLRYVVEVEPMASAEIEEVVELAAPAVRAIIRA